jgi:hypothetical protein
MILGEKRILVFHPFQLQAEKTKIRYVVSLANPWLVREAVNDKKTKTKTKQKSYTCSPRPSENIYKK